MFSQLLYRSLGNNKCCGLAQGLKTLLPRYFPEAIITSKPTLTRPLYVTRDASFFSVSKNRVSNLSIHERNKEICRANCPNCLAFVRQRATATFEVSTNVANNVFLYKYERPRFFKYMNGFGGVQLFFWLGMSYILAKQLPTCELSWDALKKYIKDHYFTIVPLVLAVLVGVGSTALIWIYTARSVRYLILHKGGQNVSFVTYHPLSKNVTITAPVDSVKCRMGRKEMKNYMSLKLSGHKFYYILDSGGEFLNPTLFDYTVGMKD